MIEAAAVLDNGLPVRSMPTFKLSVRLLAASIPGLEDTSNIWMSRQQPFMVVKLGGTVKETEFADFACVDFSSREVGAFAHECPWRFSETFTFTARLEHFVKGQGLQLCLRARKNISLGPFHFEMGAENIGEGAIDLRRHVLPACTEHKDDVHNGNTWASPILLVPIAHVQGGICRAACGLGGIVAHVAVIVKIDCDPDCIFQIDGGWRASFSRLASASIERLASFERLTSFEIGQKIIEDKVAEAGQIIDERMFSVTKAERLFWDHMGKTIQPHAQPLLLKARTGIDRILEPVEPKLQAHKANLNSKKALTMSIADAIIENPDIQHKGWVSHRTPSGRTFWHHESLGPAPWNVV